MRILYQNKKITWSLEEIKFSSHVEKYHLFPAITCEVLFPQSKRNFLSPHSHVINIPYAFWAMFKSHIPEDYPIVQYIYALISPLTCIVPAQILGYCKSYLFLWSTLSYFLHWWLWCLIISNNILERYTSKFLDHLCFREDKAPLFWKLAFQQSLVVQRVDSTIPSCMNR